MAANLQDIKRWVERGQSQGATHLIVVCDTFDYDDYPVFVSEDQDVRKVEEEYAWQSMQKVMEVYNLRIDLEPQYSAHRAFFY